MSERRAVVIGGGVGGLSAAIRLAVAGWDVTLLEKNARVGGKLNLWTAPHPNRPDDAPFRFDTGPSLLTLPFVLEDLFAAAGDDVHQRLSIVRLDPIARFQWADGQRFELRADEHERIEQVRRFSPGDVDGWLELERRGKSIWELSGDLFLSHAPEQLIRRGGGPMHGLRMLAVPFRVGMFSRYASWVNRLVRNPRLRDVLYQYATYSGASPLKAPATLAVIPHAEAHFGGWYPTGGMYRLAEELRALAERQGVRIRTSCPVRKIDIARDSRRDRVRGVTTHDGQTLTADAVVCNADVIAAYRLLIDHAHRPHYVDEKLDSMDPGGSGMVLLMGVEGTYPQLAHHTKFMPDDYAADLHAMFHSRSIPDDPCLYVCATTRTDPSQAPDGCENLFVLVSAPPLDGRIDWAVRGPAYRDRVVQTLEHRFGLTDLSRRIVVQKLLTPADFESTYHANAGSIYGLGSNSRRAAFLRPANRDPRIDGLFFAGGATHPGGGLPLVVLSGKIAAELASERVV